MAERYKPDELMVLLGTPNAESSRLYAMTVTEGDPSWAGALAGVDHLGAGVLTGWRGEIAAVGGSRGRRDLVTTSGTARGIGVGWAGRVVRP